MVVAGIVVVRGDAVIVVDGMIEEFGAIVLEWDGFGFVGRGQCRSQIEKLNTIIDRTTKRNNRSDKPHDALKPDSFPSYHSQYGPFGSSNSMHYGLSNVGYGMYPQRVMNPDGVSLGSAVPSVLMLYSMPCGPAEQLEFGAFGIVQFRESSSKSINVQQNI
ncbi:hypothetical protein U1Q18_004726 [Sarracenia purpurea var. burkii]